MVAVERHTPLEDPKPEQKQRWDPKTREPLLFTEDEAYQERLEMLREKSNELNKILEEKLEAACLPYYSWNKKSGEKEQEETLKYPKVLRVAVLLRPEFYKSSEKKNSETRYTTGDDQVTVFLHLTPENHIQMSRGHFGYTQTAKGLAFVLNILSDYDKPENHQEKERLESLIAGDDLKRLADFFIEKVSPGEETYVQKQTAEFQRAYKLDSLDAARSYFSDERLFLHQPPEIIRNLGKVALTAVLDHAVQREISEQKSLKEIKDTLEEQAHQLLSIPVLGYGKPRLIERYISDAENYVKQTIQRIIKFYKPQIFGWKKE